MSEIFSSAKPCLIKPLKLSPALGAALAFLGLDRTLPLLHGSQGCTAFALVLSVRHFREAIPLQTTAMSELSTILGGADNLEQAIETIIKRANPAVIGVCSTALTETRNDDIAGDLKALQGNRPEWADTAVIYARTPDFLGSLEQGWAAAVEAVIAALVPAAGSETRLRQVNLLTGSHLTPGDVQELKDTIEAFGLSAIVLPDLSASLDGHVPESHVPTTLGGTGVEAIRRMGESVITLAVGAHMTGAAELLHRRCGVPFQVFDRLTGLASFDEFVARLMSVSNAPVPSHVRRQRSQLVDAMLDSQGVFAGSRVALAGEPDMMVAVGNFLAELGARIGIAVSPVPAAALKNLPAERTIVGDFDDLDEAVSAAGMDGINLMIGNSHAADIAAFFDIPLDRCGFPVFDRLGAAHRVSVGYQGSRSLLFHLANMLIERGHPCGARPLQPREIDTDAPASSCLH